MTTTARRLRSHAGAVLRRLGLRPPRLPTSGLAGDRAPAGAAEVKAPLPPGPAAPPPPPHPRAAEFNALVAQKQWFHGFELVPGVVTPGHIQVNGRDYLDSIHLPPDLTGRTAIDIGTWDGYLAFELARRGAQTAALDIQDPDRTGFNTAKAITGLEVEYVHAPTGVYALPEAVGGRTFDLLFLMAVFTSVKSPLVAFERVATLMHSDSLLYFDGEILAHYAEDLSGRPVTGSDLERIARSEIPLAACYPHRYKGGQDWFVPNLACLKVWLDSAGLEAIELHPMLDPSRSPPRQRVVGWARKVRETAISEHVLI